MLCYVKNTYLKTIWGYIHYEVQMRIIKTYCDILREEAKWIWKWICSWELSLSANGMLRNTIETLKNPTIQLHLCTLFEHNFQRVTAILLGFPIDKLEPIITCYLCGFYEDYLICHSFWCIAFKKLSSVEIWITF